MRHEAPGVAAHALGADGALWPRARCASCLQSLLEDHERMKEMRERKEKERKEKEAKRLADLAALRCGRRHGARAPDGRAAECTWPRAQPGPAALPACCGVSRSRAAPAWMSSACATALVAKRRTTPPRPTRPALRCAACVGVCRDEQAKKPGYQRLRASAYDELRRQLASKGATNIPQGQVRASVDPPSIPPSSSISPSPPGRPSPPPSHVPVRVHARRALTLGCRATCPRLPTLTQVIADDALMSFGNRHRLTSSVEGLPHTPSGPGARPASARQSHARASSESHTPATP